MEAADRTHLRLGDVVQVLVHARLRDVHLHRQRLVVDAGELAEQEAAQIQRVAILFVLALNESLD